MVRLQNRLLDALVERLHRLPGVGPKMAERIAFRILKMPQEDADGLCAAINDARSGIRQCRQCYTLSEEDPCRICANETRDRDILCVLEHPQDLAAVERSGGFKGIYHVLNGALSPLDGVGPEDIRIDELLRRLKNEPVKEVIIATNPDVEGEATAVYLSKVIKLPGIRITRIAQGLPFGGELEYADRGTLIKAIEGRREMA